MGFKLTHVSKKRPLKNKASTVANDDQSYMSSRKGIDYTRQMGPSGQCWEMIEYIFILSFIEFTTCVDFIMLCLRWHVSIDKKGVRSDMSCSKGTDQQYIWLNIV